MPERAITRDGAVWSVSGAGRVTAYDRDEVTLVFERRDRDGAWVRRLARFSPLGGKSRSAALRELSDAELASLLGQSQPAWTSPEVGYPKR